jgi:hypothetical protein
MRFKSFSQFIKEGARWNSDKSGVLISVDNRPEDLFLTKIGQYTKKSAGIGSDKSSLSDLSYIFKVYYGLVSDTERKDLKETSKEGSYSDLMQRIKQGYINMVSANEPDYKMTIKDIAKHAQPDMTEYDKKLFFEFMQKTGKISSDLKYVVVAESNDAMTTMMAEIISKYTGAEIVKLKKVAYRDERILAFYRELPKMEIDSKKRLTILQQKIAEDYLRKVDSYKIGREELEKGELTNEIDFLTAMGYNPETDEKSHIFLRNVLSRVKRNESVIKGSKLFNHVRRYLNTKYNFDESFMEKVKECVTPGSTSKMLIIDDNIQHGNDFKEIFGMCGYIVDIMMVTGISTLQAVKNTEEARKKFHSSMKPTEKQKFEKLYKEAQVMEKANIDNITGYVLYERPAIVSSTARDSRDWTSPLA